jgi:hypothetical protein
MHNKSYVDIIALLQALESKGKMPEDVTYYERTKHFQVTGRKLDRKTTSSSWTDLSVHICFEQWNFEVQDMQASEFNIEPGVIDELIGALQRAKLHFGVE